MNVFHFNAQYCLSLRLKMALLKLNEPAKIKPSGQVGLVLSSVVMNMSAQRSLFSKIKPSGGLFARLASFLAILFDLIGPEILVETIG